MTSLLVPSRLLWRRLTGSPPRDHRGAATVFAVFLAVALMAGAGLVIDGGYALSAKRKAMNQAEQAARVASDELSQADLRNGSTVVNTARAQGAAQTYLSLVGARGTVAINGGRVTVTVSDDYQPAILSIVGVNHIGVEASATATSIDEDTNP